jgi:D-xylose transport system substrate-binding protein
VISILTSTALLVLSGILGPGLARASHPQAKVTVGLLFSDFTTSARWVTDRADLTAAIKKLDPSVNVVVEDAKTNQTTQLNQAKSLLTTGVKVLVVIPVDQVQARSVVQAAHANSPSVPVIAYDRLIKNAPLDAYDTFDNFGVGVKQAKWLVKHVKKGGTIVSIAGASTDNNALLFHAGAFSVLQPLFNNHTYSLGYDKYTPDWTDSIGQQEMASALTKLNNKVNGVLAANDGLAGASIAALKAQHLAGKVPVTGQDATVAGLQNILLGYQGMTIYKPIAKEANAAAQIVHLYLHGKKFTSAKTTNNGQIKVPSVLLPVTAVTKKNIKKTVIKDGFVTKAQLCTSAIPKSACAGL